MANEECSSQASIAGEKKRLRRQKERNRENDEENKEDNNVISESHGNNDGEIDAEIISTSSQSPIAGSLNEIDLGLAGWTTTMFSNNVGSDSSIPFLLSSTVNSSDFSSASITGSGEGGFIFSNSERLDGNLTDVMPPAWDSTSPSSSSDGSFADSYLLPVHELTLLRAVLRISERIGCGQQVWNLEAVSPFSQGIATPSEQLPAAWKPTASQLLVSHHPMLDFLPWPEVRDRVIHIFSMPDEMRPPNATGPLALVNFAYDFEDNSEGIRIYGGDPYDPNSWEVGQVLFERWWFIFDRDVIENSNRWRQLRGAPPLALKGTPS
ncbi:uncharacterized protein Triagg1_2272 [Trichoderma aggressivum f. europaeum]|uniref:Uncharacterized protein n=1 Tax=Trichoderma aggressivum f. europaeum TaxID=173218 RepID=A0AAE1IJW2_9HYPO|nr:hypothetical protein Triagg1_2272 [Trichoderma aggressivum f. europaeum]